MLALLQVKSLEASEPVTLSSPPINPVPGPPSAGLVERPSVAMQKIARAMPKAFNLAKAGVAGKGVKSAKTGEAASCMDVGCTPGGTSKAKSAVKGLAPATPATIPKQGRKAEPTKAAAGSKAAMPRGNLDQEVQSCGRNNPFMVIAPHLVQFLSLKKLAPATFETSHCNRLGIPKHVIGWYPDIQHGSPLHLQVKVPAAAVELALRGGTCSLELGETRTSLAPVEEPPIVIGGGAQNSVHTKLVSALVGTVVVAGSNCYFKGREQALDLFIGWRIVCMQKVSSYLNMSR